LISHGLWIRGDSFSLAILMRQECGILRGRQKLLIILMFAGIVFTYGYERVVSSFVTVNPPLIVFNTLKETLDAGYKFLYAKMRGESLRPLEEIFQRENITGSAESKVIWTSWNPYAIDYSIHAKCNVTSLKYANFEKQYKVAILKYYPELGCHYVRNTISSRVEVFQFMGYFRQRFVTSMQFLYQAGIMLMYLDNSYYLHSLLWVKDIVSMEYQENISKPFKMSEWKILSIFCLGNIAWSHHTCMCN